jgi:glycosyltransferase involved in cell wall biosynthesis
MAKIHGVLVTYQRGEQLKDYFDALAAQTRRLDSLVVIDNDPQESARWIVEEHGLAGTDINYVALGDNTGPAGGIAHGMRIILEFASDDDWIFTLDDDNPPRTSEMMGELERFGNELRTSELNVGGVGLVGGRFDNTRGQFTTVADDELRGAVLTSYIGGGHLPCYCVDAIRVVGVFDEQYFFGLEELEYGLRMLDHGFSMYAHGDLWRRERERAGRLDRKVSPDRKVGETHWRRYYSLRNLVFLMREREQPLMALRISLLNLGKPLYNLPRSPSLACQNLRQNVRAIYDAYMGHMGRTVSPRPKPYTPRRSA